ncbi:MAG TPA: hypothetical protein VHB93_01960 [Candidatus Paceibacterota bacterium]|nr:hypothetical protein [Candidatus Paceibacterota bacterium]
MTTPHHPQHHQTIKDAVLSRIQSGEVAMRSRGYFVLQTIGLAVLAALVVAITTFIINFVLFVIDVEGHGSLLTFGPRGIETFLLIFPWGWFVLDVVLVVATTLLIRRFRFGYRRSFLYVAGILFVLALVAGVALDRGTGLNALLLDDADHDRLPPPIGSLYQGVHNGAPHDQGVFRGVVDTVSTTSFTMRHDDFDRDEDDGSFTVLLPDGFDASGIAPGARVYVAGNRVPGAIAAYGVQVLPPSPDSL